MKKITLTSLETVEKHKKLTFFLMDKFNISLEEAYNIASKFIKGNF